MLYQLHRLTAIALVLVSPARLAAAIPVAITAEAHAQVASAQAPYTISLDTAKVQPVVAHTTPAPNFDTDVLAPLQADQAAEAAAAAAVAVQAAQVAAQTAAAAQAKAAAAAKAATVVAAPATGSALTQLRYCEAGGDYTRNSGNGYYGAYQYSIGSWNNYGGFARPDQAPAAVQDAKAAADQATRGWSPWPACARKLGLS